MAITVVKGNIFTTKFQTIVNTVNCVGVMGAGMALECRLRWPEMFKAYVALCKKKQMQVGLLWLYKSSDRWILNFPTKRHWKEPTQEEYLHLGLHKFMSSYQQKSIKSIAFPLLGAQNGGLDQDRSQQIMVSYLRECTIPVEIYQYDPMAPDDLFECVKKLLTERTATEIKDAVGLRADQAEHLLGALQDPSIHQLNRLASFDGIGEKTLEKVFSYALRQSAAVSPCVVQQSLDL